MWKALIEAVGQGMLLNVVLLWRRIGWGSHRMVVRISSHLDTQIPGMANKFVEASVAHGVSSVAPWPDIRKSMSSPKILIPK